MDSPYADVLLCTLVVNIHTIINITLLIYSFQLIVYYNRA